MGFWGIPVTVVAKATNPTDTDISTVDTIAQMCKLTRQAIHDPSVVRAVGECITTSSRRDLCRNIFWWIKSHIKFVEDETILAEQLGYQDPNQELLIPPQTLLAMPIPMGDCDDWAMLTAAMCLCVNVAMRFCVIACDEMQSQKFTHVYCRAYLSDEDTWVAMDTSHGAQLGWEYQGRVFRKAEWNV